MDARSFRRQVRWGLLVLCLLLAAAAGLAWNYQRTLMPVRLSVDGQVAMVRTHQGTVGELLAECGLTLQPEDLLAPSANTPLSAGQKVVVTRARLVEIEANSHQIAHRTHARTVGEVLAEAGLSAARHDELSLDGQPATPDALLPPVRPIGDAPRFGHFAIWNTHRPSPLRLVLRRAVPLTVHDGDMPFVIYTTAPTVGEALLREEITLYLGDQVMPSLGSRVAAGLSVFIRRSVPIGIRADGRTIKTRTRQASVGDTLAEQGIAVVGLDRVSPPLSAPVVDNLVIQVTRVQEAALIEQTPIPFDAVWVADDGLELDQQRLDVVGEEGITKYRFQVTYEDGQEITRTLQYTWVAQEPITRVMAYGRKVLTRTLETPEGALVYWRKLRMSATSYSASTAGVSPDNSYYGYTRLGEAMRKGIVAVDPTVVNLRTSVYVPGYGLGMAGDTGSAIQGRRIDLGYDDHNLVLWKRWVDVYLLDPPPPRYQIKWVLPNWPRE